MEAHITPLIRKLQSIAPVSDDEKQAIAALPITVRELKADADIVRDQDRASRLGGASGQGRFPKRKGDSARDAPGQRTSGRNRQIDENHYHSTTYATQIDEIDGDL